MQSSNLLSSCEDFSDSPGARPSSGAASQEVRTAADKCDGLRGSGVAAPEDGRSPLRLRLRRSALFTSLRFKSSHLEFCTKTKPLMHSSTDEHGLRAGCLPI